MNNFHMTQILRKLMDYSSAIDSDVHSWQLESCNMLIIIFADVSWNLSRNESLEKPSPGTPGGTTIPCATIRLFQYRSPRQLMLGNTPSPHILFPHDFLAQSVNRPSARQVAVNWAIATALSACFLLVTPSSSWHEHVNLNLRVG